MPGFIYKRIAGIKSSGILEWFDKIVSIYLAKVRINVKRLNASHAKLHEYYIKQIYIRNEHNSRAFFLIFYFVLEAGCIASTCCVFEVLHFYRTFVHQTLMKAVRYTNKLVKEILKGLFVAVSILRGRKTR